MKISLWSSPHEPLSDTGVHNKATGWPRSGYANGKGKKEDENNVLFFSTFSFLWVDLEKTMVTKTSPIQGSVVMFESLRLLTPSSCCFRRPGKWWMNEHGMQWVIDWSIYKTGSYFFYKAPRVIIGAILLLSI